MIGKSHPLSQKGFTLLELLVAISVLAMMAMMMWQISSGMMRTVSRSTEYDDIYHYADIVFQRMTSDLNSAFMISDNMRASFDKTEQSVRETAFIGADQGNQDTVSFASFSHLRMRRNAPESDQCEVTYLMEPDTDNHDKMLLKRKESLFLDGKIQEGGTALPMARDVLAFNLNYYDSKLGEWVPAWNSTERERLNRLPTAVQVELKIGNPREGEDPLVFTTTIGVPLADSTVEF